MCPLSLYVKIVVQSPWHHSSYVFNVAKALENNSDLEYNQSATTNLHDSVIIDIGKDYLIQLQDHVDVLGLTSLMKTYREKCWKSFPIRRRTQLPSVSSPLAFCPLHNPHS